MKAVLSYCSARMFSTGLLPMVAMSPRQARAALNDNDAQYHCEFPVEPCEPGGSARSLHTGSAAYRLTRHVVAGLALAVGILALPLLQGLVVPVMTASQDRPELIRGSPIAPALLQLQENG
jgi:hypothetical protein